MMNFVPFLQLWKVLISDLVFFTVVQLVLTYQNVTNQTGNQDMCYYNFLCAHPLGLVTDFNHIFSNLGYVMLGILFILIVSRKDFRHQKLSHEHRKKYGIPQHFGMYYAMGLALIMEGIMSGCYHVCPNHTNFQFDTAFMYTISILILLKIYQTRHPDINANAYTAFGVLAFIIFIGNVQLWFTSCHFCPLDGVLIITPKKGEFYIEKKIMKICLHSSYTMQNSFHFDEIFHKKKIMKKFSWKFVYI